MKLSILGTGNAYAQNCFNTCFILSEGDKHFLVDAGGGNEVLNQMDRVGIHWTQIHDIFVTHKHIDHILGVVWMMRMIEQGMRSGEFQGEARIYTHAAVAPILLMLNEQLMQKKDADMLGNRLKLIVIEDGQTVDIIGHKVTFFDIHSTKAPQFGFMMEDVAGGKLTCCGDEPFVPEEETYAAGSRYLLHEAYCLYEERDIYEPYEKHHSTPREAAEAAERLGVDNLILYHTMDNDIPHRKEKYTAEARLYCTKNVLVPDDLEVIELV